MPSVVGAWNNIRGPSLGPNFRPAHVHPYYLSTHSQDRKKLQIKKDEEYIAHGSKINPIQL